MKYRLMCIAFWLTVLVEAILYFVMWTNESRVFDILFSVAVIVSNVLMTNTVYSGIVHIIKKSYPKEKLITKCNKAGSILIAVSMAVTVLFVVLIASIFTGLFAEWFIPEGQVITAGAFLFLFLIAVSVICICVSGGINFFILAKRIKKKWFTSGTEKIIIHINNEANVYSKKHKESKTSYINKSNPDILENSIGRVPIEKSASHSYANKKNIFDICNLCITAIKLILEVIDFIIKLT